MTSSLQAADLRAALAEAINALENIEVQATERAIWEFARASALAARAALSVPAVAEARPVAWLWTDTTHVQAFTSKPPPSMLRDPKCQPLYLGRQDERRGGVSAPLDSKP